MKQRNTAFLHSESISMNLNIARENEYMLIYLLLFSFIILINITSLRYYSLDKNQQLSGYITKKNTGFCSQENNINLYILFMDTKTKNQWAWLILSWMWYKRGSNPESEDKKKKHWAWEISVFLQESLHVLDCTAKLSNLTSNWEKP